MASSSSTTAAATEQVGSSGSGPAGLGSMSSLSAECTPLKHKYDGCFNLWFQEYLGIPSDSSAGGEGSVSAASGSSASPERKRRFWGGGGASKDVSGKTGATPGVTMSAAEATTKRAQLRDDLEGRCGALFREYQSCVKKALGDRNLLPLISQAREFNPFPLPAEGGPGSDPDTSGNHPFPFPEATPAERMESERREGW